MSKIQTYQEKNNLPIDFNNNQNGKNKQSNEEANFSRKKNQNGSTSNLGIEEYLNDSDDCLKQEWCIRSSKFAKSTCNPVRKMIEQMKIEPNPALQMIALSIGDPTVLSKIAKPDTVTNAIIKCVQEKKYDGYGPSYGTETARQAVAKYCSRPDKLVYKTNDILLTCGCSHALDLCLTVLGNPGQNFLIPRPGFSIYKTLCGTLDINVKYYDLQPEKNWEIDLDQLDSLIDDETVGIVVNNPSNPCGSVYSRKHMVDIIKLAEKHKLPIIADEVYGDMVFPGNEFFYFSELSETVPVLSCNALSKRFILPGWRFGWIAIHDPKNYLKEVRAGFNDLTTRILGPNTLLQGALPEILENTPQSYYDDIMKYLSDNADIVYEALSKLPGLKPRKASGAMYIMVGIDIECFPGINNDLEFVQLLIKEKSVFCLPASVFECPNYFRIVITMQKEKILEACQRIGEFVEAHYNDS